MTLRVRGRRKEGWKRRGWVRERKARRKDSGEREPGVKESRGRKGRKISEAAPQQNPPGFVQREKTPFQVPKGPEQVSLSGAPPYRDPKGV